LTVRVEVCIHRVLAELSPLPQARVSCIRLNCVRDDDVALEWGLDSAVWVPESMHTALVTCPFVRGS
jgi:hypothetical protein